MEGSFHNQQSSKILVFSKKMMHPKMQDLIVASNYLSIATTDRPVLGNHWRQLNKYFHSELDVTTWVFLKKLNIFHYIRRSLKEKMLVWRVRSRNHWRKFLQRNQSLKTLGRSLSLLIKAFKQIWRYAFQEFWKDWRSFETSTQKVTIF